MLRKIACPRRTPDEDWVDWIRRSTREALASARKAGICLWVDAHLKCKWNWAGHVIRMNTDRLAFRALIWRDSRWQASENEVPTSLRIRRPNRTRWFRYEDELRRYATRQQWDSWQDVAQQRDAAGSASRWLQHSSSFMKFSK